MIEDEDEKRLDEAITDLQEHYDSVQIFVTRYDGDKEGQTMSLGRGGGNWFARFGQIKSWLLEVEADESIGRMISRSDNEE